MPADPTVKQQSYTRATCYILFPPRVGYPRYSLYVAGRERTTDTILAEDQHHALFTGWFLLLVIEQEARSKLAVRLGLLSTTFPRLYVETICPAKEMAKMADGLIFRFSFHGSSIINAINARKNWQISRSSVFRNVRNNRIARSIPIFLSNH